IVSRLKVMAHLDISERRLPQGGKIKFQLGGGNEIELRVETMPTAGNNEDAVLRILTAKRSYALDDSGLTPTVLSQIKMVADKPYGMILCVGPTGSGKTTTLHAILAHINKPERKIWTAEDPIEITQDGLRQVQVYPKIGLTFKKAMTAFLRADPDVIMIGEMRDKETADIAIEASLTGHLVLSTLHTNSAVETLIRLLDLGCDPFSFADAMLGIIAKRLCKRICQDCKEEYHPTREEYDELVAGYGGGERWKTVGVEYSHSFKLFRGKGCDVCNDTGFKGRIGLHEMLLGSEQLRRLILRRAPTDEFFEFAQDQGMTTLLQDGILKVLEGNTTFKQARAVATK
ncbi:MAG: GspE/PulE family protein, partial [Nitrospiraceae bacterium]